MQVVGAGDKLLRGDLIMKVVVRSDCTPIPGTVEVTAKRTKETLEALAQGKVISVGGDGTEYLVVKVEVDQSKGLVQGDRELAYVKAIGILNSCEAIGRRLQRSIIREGSTFADIYRSIGASAVVADDFAVPAFSCFIGMLPTPEIARVLQEEAATVFFSGGKLRFRRLAELAREKARMTYPVDRTEELGSDFLERHAVPFAITTTPANAIINTRREAARGVVYRPRGDVRILNNVSSGMIQRRKLRESLSPDVNAGTRIDIEDAPHIVVTAAHVRAAPSEGEQLEEFSQFWLAEVIR